MAQKPDWTRIGVIVACVIGVATVAGEVLPYFYPPDPQHPVKFDFLFNQISISISPWSLALNVIAICAVSYLVWAIVRRRRKPKLVILSALYGADDASDRDVTEVIRRAIASNGTVLLWIDNNLFGFDPKIGKPKELKVHYTDRKGASKSVIRPENNLLVLPEDEWLKNLYVQASETITELRSGITPLSPEYLKLENDHNELKKKLFAAQQAQLIAEQRLEEASKQLETPKITVSVVGFEAYEEKSDEPLTQTERLLYPSNNRILIRVGLKISNEHRAPTNIQSIGISVSGSVGGRIDRTAAPDSFPENIRQPIQYGFPLQVSLDFWIDHSDMQSIVRNYFVVAAVDGTGQQIETSPQQIPRVLPHEAVGGTISAAPANPPARNFAFDPKQTRIRLNADQMIALELAKSTSGMLGITLAPINTTPRSIASYQVEVAEVNSWSEKYKQFLEGIRFNRRPVVSGGTVEPLTKHNGQWLVRALSKDGKQFLTLYNDDSTPLRWPNDDTTDVEIWRLALVTVYGKTPEIRNNGTALPVCYLLVRWDRKFSTMLMTQYDEPIAEVQLAPESPIPLSRAETAVLEWVRRIQFPGKPGYQKEYPGLVATTPRGEKMGYLMASTAAGMEKLLQETDFNNYDDLRRLYIVMVGRDNLELSAAARSMLNRKLPDRISVVVGHVDGNLFILDEEHPDPKTWRSA
jgi:hypothetical protein